MKRFKILLLAIFTLLTATTAYSAGIVTYPKFSVTGDNGQLLTWGCLYSYDCGTTDKAATCANNTCSSFNTNPITLDSRGEADVYSGQCYKFVLYEADNDGVCDSTPSTTLIWSKDNIPDATILDEDDMVSNSNTQAVTQQSLVEYVDDTSVSYVALATSSGATLIGSTAGTLQSVLTDYEDRITLNKADIAGNAVSIAANTAGIGINDGVIGNHSITLDEHADQIEALQVGQGASQIGYATQAGLYADLAHIAGTVGYVGNDPTPAKNGNYIKLGASGSGSWDQSSFDRVAVVEQDVTDLTAVVALKAESAEVDLKVPTTVNLYDTSLDEGGFVATNGTLGGTIATYARSGFQAVLPNTEYTLAGYTGEVPTIGRTIVEFTAGEVFISNITPVAEHVGDSFTFTTDPTAAFIMFNLRYQDADVTVQPDEVMLLLGGVTPNHFIRHESAEAYPLVTQTDVNFADIVAELAALKAMVIPTVWNSTENHKAAWFRDYTANRVLVLGDSFVRGNGATDPETGGWPYLLDTQLKSALGDGGGGYYGGILPAVPNTDSANLRKIVFAGTWSAITSLGPFRYMAWATVAGSTATVDVEGDTVDILFSDNQVSGEFSVTIDGGAPETFALPELAGGPFAAKVATVSTGDTGSHTIVVTTIDGRMNLVGIVGYNSTILGSAAVHRMGRDGLKSDGFGANADWDLEFISMIDPQITVIALGINDWLSQTVLATYRANIEYLIEKGKLSGRVLLVNNVEFSDTVHPNTMPDYNAELLSLAQEHDCFLLDMHTRWGGSTDAAFALGFQPADTGGHPTDAGHEDFRDAVYDAITSE